MGSGKLNAFKQKAGSVWNNFSPTQKKTISITGLVGVALTLMLYGLGDSKSQAHENGYVSPEAEKPQINLVATQKLDEFTLASLSNTIEAQKKEIEELKKFKQNFAGIGKEVEALKQVADQQQKKAEEAKIAQDASDGELQKYKKTVDLITMLSSSTPKDQKALYYMYLDNDQSKRDPLVEKLIGFDMDKYLASLQGKVDEEPTSESPNQNLQLPEAKAEQKKAKPYVNGTRVQLAGATEHKHKRLNGQGQPDDSFCYDRDSSMILYNTPAENTNKDEQRAPERLEPLKINTISSANNTRDINIPATSVFKAELLTGLDAPTNDGAKNDPFPVLLKLTNVDFLPNRRKVDLDECFVLASSYGDLSSERAYMRTQSISCVTKSGYIAEGEMKGYINGPDGKAGVAGRLVSREGQLIAKSLAIGFMEGAVGAISKQQNLVVAGDSKVADVLKQGTIGGASKTIDRIANYYLSVANKTFPLVEVNAGQSTDIILTAPLSLKVSNRKVTTKPLKIRSI